MLSWLLAGSAVMLSSARSHVYTITVRDALALKHLAPALVSALAERAHYSAAQRNLLMPSRSALQ